MRVATSFIQAQSAFDIQRIQRSLVEAQHQASTERKADDLKGFAREAGALMSARAYQAKSESFIASGQAAVNRFAAQDLALTQVRDSSLDIRASVANAIALDRGDELISYIESAFGQVTAALNTSFAGVHLFGGLREDQAPVTISSINDLAAPAVAADGFVDGGRRSRVQLGENTFEDAGPLAAEVATPLFESMKRFKDFIDLNGPFTGALTPAQKTFLTAELSALDTAVDHAGDYVAANGAAQARAETAVVRLTGERDYFTNIINDLSGVDLAEVATRISQAQSQFQAQAEIYNILRDTTLLNYLR